MRASLVACFALGACATAPAAPSASLEALPAASLVALDGGQSLVARAKTRVLVLDFWASWCEPCQAGFPKLDRLAKAYATQGLVVVGVDVGEDRAVVEAFLAEVGVSYSQYIDPDFVLADHLGSRSLPSVIVFDREGRVVARGDGLTPELLDVIRRLLD